MSYGGYHCYPRRFGGNRHDGKPLTEVLHRSLNAQRGPAFTTEDDTTVVSIENLAYARAIAYDGWETNGRVALQWDPFRVTDMRDRWEAIFKIRPAPDASDRSRRAELVRRWQRFGAITNHARMVTALAAEIPDYFVAVEYISLANAIVHVPDLTYPWGTTAPGSPWSSTVAHFLIRLQKPAGATEGDFYDAAGKVGVILDPIVSAFATFNWYRAPAAGYTAINVPGGPSAAGFYLDAPNNLDNNVFARPPPDLLTVVTPTISTGGGIVEIRGVSIDDTTSVTIDAASSSFVVGPSGVLKVTAASHIAGAVDIVIATPIGSRTITAGLTFVQAPLTMALLTPSTGPNSGGTAFTITGTGFFNVIDVTINGFTLASWSVIDDNTIDAITDSVGGPGVFSVLVYDGVTTVSLPFTFT